MLLTLGRFRATIVSVEKQLVLHNMSVCICSLRYPVCNAHAPYCRLWPAPALQYFSTYLINGTIFEKVTRTHNLVLLFSTTFVWNISHSKKKWASMIKYVHVYRSSGKVSLILSDFNETWIFLTDFRKILKYKFHENPFGGSGVAPWGRTDVQTWRS